MPDDLESTMAPSIERHGAGFPVLMISGLGGLASFWQEQVAAFSKRYDVITHDSRGVGESDPIRGGYTVDRRRAGQSVALMLTGSNPSARICLVIRPAARSRRLSRSITRTGWRASCCRRPGPNRTPISGACTRCARKCCSGSAPSSYVVAMTLFLYLELVDRLAHCYAAPHGAPRSRRSTSR